MKKIGFMMEQEQKEKYNGKIYESRTDAPRKSVVQVYFEERGTSYAYYNDQFDLQEGDIVYVEGKLEGVRGRVVSVNYSFKIKLSDYKKVIGMADTTVKGQFYHAGSHFVTFDPSALPAEQVYTWYRAPKKEEDVFAFGRDDKGFLLENLQGMQIGQTVAMRGENYYQENRVRYISIDGEYGYAIVEGTEPYEVEFQYLDGEIRNLVCSCFCSYPCKHEFAAMLQLKETLKIIKEQYQEMYKETGYFAAIGKGEFFSFVIEGKKNGGFMV